jgi:hypothetical protein
MKLKDYLILIGGMILLLVFILFMIKFSNERKEIEIIDKQIKADTVLVDKQRELEQQDIYILNQQKRINSTLRTQDNRLNILEIKVDSINNILRVE